MSKNYRLKRIWIGVLLVITMGLSGCNRFMLPKRASKIQLEKKLSIVFASDLHYLSPEMTDYGDYFMNLISKADGKVTHYTPEIIEAFVNQLLDMSVDALVLSGDLTLNGDEQSHQGLVKLLEPLIEAGIKVFVMPGNHDVDGDAYYFEADGVKSLDALSSISFPELYKDLGYGDGYASESGSLSYTAKVSDDFWILMIDVNGNGVKGFVTGDTLAWIESQLQAAQQVGAMVIGVTHQNLFIHHPHFQLGYQILAAEKIAALYKTYGVKLHFSGHLHLQHIVEQDGIADVVSSSLAVTPHQYGLLEIATDALMTYQTQAVDVAGWAKKNGISDENLLDFSNYSKDFFNQSTEYKVSRFFETIHASADEIRLMKDFAIQVNQEYFAGVPLGVTSDNQGFLLWQEKLSENFFKYYMENILEQPLIDMNQWTSSKKKKQH